MVPQLVDLDGDGHRDILSGSGRHAIVMFAGLPDRKFAAPTFLAGIDGAPLEVARPATGVSAVDWNGDGVLDLLVNAKRQLAVLPGRRSEKGRPGTPGFGPAIYLTAAGRPAEAGARGAPWATDWDGDGDLDVVVGDADGGVWMYRTRVTAKERILSPRQHLLHGHHSRQGARICVVDWDRDGLPDLAMSFRQKKVIEAPGLTEGEEAELATANALYEELSAELRELNASRPDFRKEKYAERQRRRGDLEAKMRGPRKVRNRLREKQRDVIQWSRRFEVHRRRR